MSRIGTKKPPIKNAYYAPGERVPAMNSYGKAANKIEYDHAPNRVKDDFISSHSDNFSLKA